MVIVSHAVTGVSCPRASITLADISVDTSFQNVNLVSQH